jgi:hypothetical protein
LWRTIKPLMTGPGRSRRLSPSTGEAITLYEQTLADREWVLGADHLDTLGTHNNLASAYRDAGRTAEDSTLRRKPGRWTKSTRQPLIRRSMGTVRPVRRNPYRQVRVHRVSDADVPGPVLSDQSVKKSERSAFANLDRSRR